MVASPAMPQSLVDVLAHVNLLYAGSAKGAGEKSGQFDVAQV